MVKGVRAIIATRGLSTLLMSSGGTSITAISADMPLFSPVIIDTDPVVRRESTCTYPELVSTIIWWGEARKATSPIINISDSVLPTKSESIVLEVTFGN